MNETCRKHAGIEPALAPVSRDHLRDLLAAYWFAPPVALWRAVELRTAAQEEYERPMLDLGCGDGLVAAVLFGADGAVDVGCDPWPAQLGRAARSGAYHHIDLANGHHLPYPDGSFCTVFSNSVLEHIPDVTPVLREVGRTLRPGGRFIFTAPSEQFRSLLDGYIRRAAAGDADGADAYATAVDARLAHEHHYSPSEWGSRLESAGMRLVRACYYMPKRVERLWDRSNDHYGVGRRWSPWSLLASPRLFPLGYQPLVRRSVVQGLSRRWRADYEMDVADGEKGGGLLAVAQRTESKPAGQPLNTDR